MQINRRMPVYCLAILSAADSSIPEGRRCKSLGVDPRDKLTRTIYLVTARSNRHLIYGTHRFIPLSVYRVVIACRYCRNKIPPESAFDLPGYEAHISPGSYIFRGAVR